MVWAFGFVSAAWVLGGEAQHGGARSLGVDGSRMEGPFLSAMTAALGLTKPSLAQMETDGDLLAL